MMTMFAIATLWFAGFLCVHSYSDTTACVGDKTVDFNIGSPDDPLKIRFECAGSSTTAEITSCFLNSVEVKKGKEKSITLKSGNKYKLQCFYGVRPIIIEAKFVKRVCSGSRKATIGVSESTEKIEVSFECNREKSKIQKCTPSGEEEGFAVTDKVKSRFGGKSGKKYIMDCRETSNPVIEEHYTAERCLSQTKFVDSLAVQRSTAKVDVEFQCGADGEISECRPESGSAVKADSRGKFTKGDAMFEIYCASSGKPTITAL